jgi:RNA polymerase sigma-70 factor, ECF subfamily
MPPPPSPTSGPPASDLPAASDPPAADYPAADHPAADHPAADHPAAGYPAAPAAVHARNLIGDPAAFVRATQADVWRFVASLVEPAAADDLTQETYLRALRALDAFEGRASARTWLLGIARRVCADHLRAVRRSRRLAATLAGAPELPTGPDPAGWVGAADLLDRLPDDRRGAFVLTQLLGMSYAEAAVVEGVPVGTIRSRVARARIQLIEALGG